MMKRQQRKPLFASLLVATALSAGLMSACAPQVQGGSNATSATSAVAQESASSTSATDSVSSTSAADSASSSSSSSATDSSSAQATSATGAVDLAKTFPSWNAKSESLAKLVAYVEDVTDEKSANYVQPEERVATFDMDGTVLCEKAPVYLDYCMLMHRVLDDPTYNAPEEYKKTCEQLRANADKGIVADELDNTKNEIMVAVFKDMAPEDFRDYTSTFIDTVQAEGFEGMTYGESLYKPMKEVISYLEENDFTVYIVSACEREVARTIAVNKLGIAPDRVIGTDYGTKATGQGDEAANKYTFQQNDKIVFDGTKALEVAKMNKVVYIQREIGRRPILAFGNSSGDYAMLNYAQSNPDHPGMGLLVICDDVEREYGNLERATKQMGEAAEAGWTTFSMANDWATIYGEGVVKTELPADAQQLAAAA